MLTMQQFRKIYKEKQLKLLFFWGENPSKQYPVTKDCLSQWYPAAFEDEGIYYPTSEHYMMAKKALLFQDDKSYQNILQANHPKEAKALGRQVKNFDREIWDEHKTTIVTKANYLKFKQNDELLQFLIETKEYVLIEASPVDCIWGIGLGEEDPSIHQIEAWKGENLLGFSIMAARDQLLREME